VSFGRTRNGAPFSRLEITFHLWWEGCPEGPRELDRFKVFSRKWNGREKRPVSTRDVTGLLDHRPRRRVHWNLPGNPRPLGVGGMGYALRTCRLSRHVFCDKK